MLFPKKPFEFNYFLSMDNKALQLKNLWICGTDTGVGKSHFSAYLLSIFNKEISIGLWKPAQSGSNECLDATLRTDTEFCEFYGQAPCHATYTLKAALAPYLAAEQEGIALSEAQLLKDFAYWNQNYEVLLCEGAGGVYSPVLRDQKQIELYQKTSLNCIVVARDGLGTINQTLMTMECLQNQGMNILGFVFGQRISALAAENARTICQMSGITFLGTTPTLTTEGFETDPLFLQRIRELFL